MNQLINQSMNMHHVCMMDAWITKHQIDIDHRCTITHDDWVVTSTSWEDTWNDIIIISCSARYDSYEFIWRWVIAESLLTCQRVWCRQHLVDYNKLSCTFPTYCWVIWLILCCFNHLLHLVNVWSFRFIVHCSCESCDLILWCHIFDWFSTTTNSHIHFSFRFTSLIVWLIWLIEWLVECHSCLIGSGVCSSQSQSTLRNLCVKQFSTNCRYHQHDVAMTLVYTLFSPLMLCCPSRSPFISTQLLGLIQQACSYLILRSR